MVAMSTMVKELSPLVVTWLSSTWITKIFMVKTLKNLSSGTWCSKFAQGGYAEYDTGKKDSIGKTWQENDAKGARAKIYTKSGEWIGEWVDGNPAEYFYGDRKDVEKTQWMAGNGDGFLVWDHNGDGIINDNTEMMSEFDKDGNVAFANGYEKLAHYFDKDKNGIIEGAELNGLMFWVDDGDAKTEAGELQPLSTELPPSKSCGSKYPSR